MHILSHFWMRTSFQHSPPPFGFAIHRPTGLHEIRSASSSPGVSHFGLLQEILLFRLRFATVVAGHAGHSRRSGGGVGVARRLGAFGDPGNTLFIRVHRYGRRHVSAADRPSTKNRIRWVYADENYIYNVSARAQESCEIA